MAKEVTKVTSVAQKVKARGRRHLRVRKKIRGTPERPRLCVYKSNRHIYAQIIDDIGGRTLASSASVHRELFLNREELDKKGVAELVGRDVARKALSQKITEVVFDRGGFLFHGRVKSLAEGARAEGLKF